MVTGAGGPGAVNLSRSLLAMHPQPWILAADASPHYVLLALGHERVVVPRASDRETYLDEVNRLIDLHDIDFVMPNNSLEIAVLSAERERIAAALFLPDPPVLDAANSKWASYEAWAETDIPVPLTALLSTPDDVHQAFDEMQPDGDTPVWVRGAGIPGKGIGVASLPCRTVAQAIQWIDYWKGWGGMIASEYLPGRNLTWMGLLHEGRLVTSQGRERLAYVIPHVSPSGITGAPAISKTIHDAEVNRIGEAAVLALDPNYTGVGFVDMKGDAEGRPRVTELNAGRFGTTHYFYTAAGVNFPELLLQVAAGEEPRVPTRDILPPELVWIRTLDAGPVLTTTDAIASGQGPSLATGDRWPTVPQRFDDFVGPMPPPWDGDGARD
jgi:carbamoyl-phosphate synthase large subunit